MPLSTGVHNHSLSLPGLGCPQGRPSLDFFVPSHAKLILDLQIGLCYNSFRSY